MSGLPKRYSTSRGIERDGEEAREMFEIMAVRHSAEIGAREEVDKADSNLVVALLANQRWVVEGERHIIVVEREVVEAHACRTPRGRHIEDGERRDTRHLSLQGGEGYEEQYEYENLSHDVMMCVLCRIMAACRRDGYLQCIAMTFKLRIENGLPRFVAESFSETFFTQRLPP